MAMIRKRSAESGVSVNTLLLTYFFERFLVRLSGSTYKTDLILKGGFLLSSIFVDLRLSSLSAHGEPTSFTIRTSGGGFEGV